MPWSFMSRSALTSSARCCGFGHIESHCKSSSRCNVCAEGHKTEQHRCTVAGCQTGAGCLCRNHGKARCPSCKRDHLGGSRDCQVWQAAKVDARGWRRGGRRSVTGLWGTGSEDNVAEAEKEAAVGMEEIMPDGPGLGLTPVCPMQPPWQLPL
jgi:hypothetical protein